MGPAASANPPRRILAVGQDRPDHRSFLSGAAAATIARMPARTGAGSVDHSAPASSRRTASARSESVSGSRANIATASANVAAFGVLVVFCPVELLSLVLLVQAVVQAPAGGCVSP